MKPIFAKRYISDHECVSVLKDGDDITLILCEHLTEDTIRKLAKILQMPGLKERL